MEREGIQMALATDPDLIREGIDAMTAGHRVEEPRLPLFSSGIDDLASPTDELLEGFGER
jgi:hypothetical protein